MKKIMIFWILTAWLAVSCSDKAEQIHISEGHKRINGSDVYYKIMGVGQPIVVIHGGPVLDHSYFLPQFTTLAVDHQVIFYDQRACGRSSIAVDTTSMSLEGFVEDIELLRKKLDLEKITVLGHSWGGLLAMKYAIKYPNNLQKLILSNSVPASLEDWQEEQSLLSQKVTTADSLTRNEIIQSGEMKDDPASAIKKLMLLSFKTQFHDTTRMDSLNLNIAPDFLDRSAIFSQLGPDLAHFDLHHELEQLEVPTLVIYGEKEPAAALSGKKLKQEISGATLEIIEKSGHFPFVEQPDAYFDAINKFLNDKN